MIQPSASELGELEGRKSTPCCRLRTAAAGMDSVSVLMVKRCGTRSVWSSIFSN
jgi:hypothetical protein